MIEITDANGKVVAIGGATLADYRRALLDMPGVTAAQAECAAVRMREAFCGVDDGARVKLRMSMESHVLTWSAAPRTSPAKTRKTGPGMGVTRAPSTKRARGRRNLLRGRGVQ